MVAPLLRFIFFTLTIIGAAKAEYNIALADSLRDISFDIRSGLAASERAGKPISAKFELDGKLQLSVYTAKFDDFTEVVIDPTTGAILKAEKITDAEDRAAAANQKAAMEKAGVTLTAAIDKACNANPGYRAVSVTPKLDGAHALADVELLPGATFKDVTEKLD